MFLKENIIITKPMFSNGDMVDYDFQKEALYKLCKDIIEKLDITTLEKIIVNGKLNFGIEQGNAKFDFKLKKSSITLNRMAFINFNRNDVSKHLRRSALATIYHEFYHVYDRENLYHLVSENLLENSYFVIGFKYWSEFYAYYKTSDLYVDKAVFNVYKDLQIKIRERKYNEDDIQKLYYVISEIAAFCVCAKDEIGKIVKEFENTYNNKCYINLQQKLVNIMSMYPKKIIAEDFIILGELYYKFGQLLSDDRIRLASYTIARII